MNRIHSGIRQLRETMRTDDDIDNGYDDDPPRNGASCTGPPATFYRPIGVDATVASAIQLTPSSTNQFRETIMCMDDDDDTVQTDHHDDDGCYDDGYDDAAPTIGITGMDEDGIEHHSMVSDTMEMISEIMKRMRNVDLNRMKITE